MSKMNNAGPGNASFAEADDDIVDLLEVVKPGKPVASPPDPDEDFSKDLESMLDTLSRAQTEKEEEAGLSAPASVQPFPDPTPVDYKVDYNEQLDLPGMDDLDSILHTLGPAARNAAAKAGSPAEEADAPDAALPEAASLPDLDALPPPARQTAAVGRKPVAAQDEDLLSGYLDDLQAAPPAAGPAASQARRDADIPALEDMGLEALDDAGHGSHENGPAPDTVAGKSREMEAQAPVPPPFAQQPAPASGQPAAADAARTGTRLAGVDMHELDSLLDDMLASAPASGAAGQAPVAPAAPAPAVPPSAAPAAHAGALAGELASLRQEMLELRGDFEHRLAGLAQTEPEAGGASEAVLRQLETQSADIASQSAKLEDLELTQASREQEYERRIKELEGALTEQTAQLTRIGGQLEAQVAAQAEADQAKEDGAARFAELEQALAAHASQLSACESLTEQAAVAQAARLAALEEKLAEMATQLAHSEARVVKQLSSAQESRLAALEEKLSEQAAQLARSEAHVLEQLSSVQEGRLAELEEKLSEQAAQLAQSEDRVVKQLSAAQESRLAAVEEAAGGYAARLELLEEAQAQSDARAVEQGAILNACTTKAEDMDTTLAEQAGRALEDALRLAEQGDQVSSLVADRENMNARLAALDDRFAALDDRFASLGKSMAGVERRFGELHAKLDRLAAEAAAKVIREELAALLDPDA